MHKTSIFLVYFDYYVSMGLYFLFCSQDTAAKKKTSSDDESDSDGSEDESDEDSEEDEEPAKTPKKVVSLRYQSKYGILYVFVY